MSSTDSLIHRPDVSKDGKRGLNERELAVAA